MSPLLSFHSWRSTSAILGSDLAPIESLVSQLISSTNDQRSVRDLRRSSSDSGRFAGHCTKRLSPPARMPPALMKPSRPRALRSGVASPSMPALQSWPHQQLASLPPPVRSGCPSPAPRTSELRVTFADKNGASNAMVVRFPTHNLIMEEAMRKLSDSQSKFAHLQSRHQPTNNAIHVKAKRHSPSPAPSLALVMAERYSPSLISARSSQSSHSQLAIPALAPPGPALQNPVENKAAQPEVEVISRLSASASSRPSSESSGKQPENRPKRKFVQRENQELITSIQKSSSPNDIVWVEHPHTKYAQEEAEKPCADPD